MAAEKVTLSSSPDDQDAENPQDPSPEKQKGEEQAEPALTDLVADDLLKLSQRPDLHHDISYHPGRVHFYLAPQQRQTWGDSQVLPRVNWGDLFFDLFYVAAAYNMGNILNRSPSALGALYFVGTFFPVLDNWKDKLYYDARFTLRDDVFHRIFEIFFFMTNATVILHIRTVDVMANSRDNIDMFAFSAAQLGFTLLAFGGYLEIYFKAEGKRCVLKRVAYRDFKQKIVPFLFYLAASIVSGMNYYSNNAADVVTNDDHHRNLAANDNMATGDSSEFVDHLPIWLCIGGSLATFAYLVLVVQFMFPADGSHKEFTVPLNVGFVIHRNGEWIMLMLGAGILNLLIVDVSEASDYYVTFYCGILTVVLLQYLHFRSQPHNPDDHAIRRSKDAGVWFGFINGVYSASLLCVGATYKLFLYEFTYAARRLEEERELAGGGSESSTEDRRQQEAYLFGGAMAMVWFCSDVILLLHLGLKDSMGRCHCSKSKSTNVMGLVLLFLRLCLIPVSATVGVWQTDPAKLAPIGLGTVVAQLLLRHLGGMYFPQNQVHAHHGHHDVFGHDNGGKSDEIDPEEYAWPNVTHAQAERNSSVDEDDKHEENRING